MPEDVPGKAALVIGGLMALGGYVRRSPSGLLVAAAGGFLIAKTLREAEAKRNHHGINSPPANRPRPTCESDLDSEV